MRKTIIPMFKETWKRCCTTTLTQRELENLVWLLFGFLAAMCASYAAGADLQIRSDLGHVVQSIQQIILRPEQGTPAQQQAQSITLAPRGHALHISGQLLLSPQGVKNTISPQSRDSQLYNGKDNHIDGQSSLIFEGYRNRILNQSRDAIIIWGSENTIRNHSETSFILGGNENTINNSSNSIILGGNRNSTTGTGNALLGGENKSVKGESNYAFGANINYLSPRKHTFVWSDNEERKPSEKFLTPSKDNTFYIRSAGGVGVNTANPASPGVHVEGMIQLADQQTSCTAQTLGSIKFTKINGEGCFLGCNNENGIISRRPLVKQSKCGTAPAAINGQCDPLRVGQCLLGTPVNDNRVTACGQRRTWNCQGSNGGTSASCQVQNAACQTYNCGGSLPAHAVAWSNSPQSNLTTQATWGYSATNTNLACKFGCAAGYTWNNNACVAQTSKSCKPIDEAYYNSLPTEWKSRFNCSRLTTEESCVSDEIQSFSYFWLKNTYSQLATPKIQALENALSKVIWVKSDARTWDIYLPGIKENGDFPTDSFVVRKHQGGNYDWAPKLYVRHYSPDKITQQIRHHYDFLWDMDYFLYPGAFCSWR